MSTLVQGASFEPLARRLRVTTSEPALPRPLTEAATIRRRAPRCSSIRWPATTPSSGADQRPRAAARRPGQRDRPRLRGDTPAWVDAPAGGGRPSRARPGRVGRRARALTARWRTGPVGPPARAAHRPRGRAPIFCVWPWREADGDPARPREIRGREIALHLRIRRDEPGGLWLLDDGRYAVTGALGAIGGHAALTRWAVRRLDRAGPDERAWLQTVIGAIAADRHR